MAVKIKTPIVSTNDLVKKLRKLQAQTVSGDTDLKFRLGDNDLIVTDVRWNEWGDEVEIILANE